MSIDIQPLPPPAPPAEPQFLKILSPFVGTFLKSPLSSEENSESGDSEEGEDDSGGEDWLEYAKLPGLFRSV